MAGTLPNDHPVSESDVDVTLADASKLSKLLLLSECKQKADPGTWKE